MCRALGISRQTYYYKVKPVRSESDLEEAVETSFQQSRYNYGARKIKADLAQQGICVSRRKVRRIMSQRQLVSNYTRAQFKPHKTPVNDTTLPNLLKREFKSDCPLEKIVTDLTYVRVGQAWYYVCFVTDLFNREIIGSSYGPRKDAELVKCALQSIRGSLAKVSIFHTDRGKEFDNALISEVLETFGIAHSLSQKGCPYDNAVAESTYKSFKMEFVYPNQFETPESLKLGLFDYVNWWNHWRLHGALGYQTPVSLRMQRLAKLSLDSEPVCDTVTETILTF